MSLSTPIYSAAMENELTNWFETAVSPTTACVHVCVDAATELPSTVWLHQTPSGLNTNVLLLLTIPHVTLWILWFCLASSRGSHQYQPKWSPGSSNSLLKALFVHGAQPKPELMYDGWSHAHSLVVHGVWTGADLGTINDDIRFRYVSVGLW